MSMFDKVRSGELTKRGFERTLAGYQTQKAMLIIDKAKYGPELYFSKMNELEMCINMTQLFIDKYEEIASKKKIG